MRRASSPGRVFSLAGLFCVLAATSAGAAMVTSAKRGALPSPAVRQALLAPTRDGQVEALLLVLAGEDLTAAVDAGDALASIGPDAVPRLVSEMRRNRNNWLIGGVLAKMGTAAVDPLIEGLISADEGTAVDCIYLLGELQDRRAVPQLSRYLADPRERVRMYAVTALLSIGGDRAVEVVLERLVQESRNLGGFIVESLVRHGREGVEPLLRNASSPDPRVRREVAYLLGRLQDPRASESLVALLEDPEPLVRRNAAFSLGQLGPALAEPAEVVQALAGHLTDPEVDVAGAARSALVRFGERALPELTELCRRGGLPEVLASANALREIGSSKAEPILVELLRHPKRMVRVVAVAGLMVVGTRASLDALLSALRDEDLRWFAALALERIGTNSPEFFLESLPSDPNLGLRLEILVRLGPPVVPYLVRYLQDEALGRRMLALWALGEIGDANAAREVVAALDDPSTGWLAGQTLRKLGDGGFDELARYATRPRTETGALHSVDALALFEDQRGIRALEECLTGAVPRKAKVRAAVRLTAMGEPQAAARLRSYLEGDGQELWADIEQALREEGQIR